MTTNKMRVICRNCGECFAFHGATAPHQCPITESHTEQTNFAPIEKHHRDSLKGGLRR